MSQASTVKALIRSSPHLANLGVNLGWIYLTLGWRVRKTRRAFEKQLVLQGMSKEDAQRLSRCFMELKNSMTSMLRGGISF